LRGCVRVYATKWRRSSCARLSARLHHEYLRAGVYTLIWRCAYWARLCARLHRHRLPHTTCLVLASTSTTSHHLSCAHILGATVCAATSASTTSHHLAYARIYIVELERVCPTGASHLHHEVREGLPEWRLTIERVCPTGASHRLPHEVREGLPEWRLTIERVCPTGAS
jgi:hypothetical protein